MAADVLVALGAFTVILLQPSMQREHLHTDVGLVTAVGLAFLVALSWPLILVNLGAYESQRRNRLSYVLGRLFGANGFGALVLSAFAFSVNAPVAPAFPMLLAASVFVVQAAIRAPVFWALKEARRHGRNYRNVLIIGAGPRALSAERTIVDNPDWGLHVVGFVDEPDTSGPGYVPLVPEDRVHKLMDLPGLLRETAIDQVLVACPLSMLERLTPVVRECALVGVPITLLTDLFGEELPPPRVGIFDSRSTITYAPVHHNDLELAVKRGIDIVGALVGLLLSAVPVAIAAAAIRLSSPGPIFFKQRRSGLYGRPFMMYKLRTMVPGAEDQKAELMALNEMDGPVFKIKSDPRVTPVGRFLRKYSIDELPQFWNVLKGDMSLVGPRPPTPDEVAFYEGGERRRLSMRPGLTCIWQTSGRNDLGFGEWMRLDLQYIDGWNLMNDLKIIARTVPVMIRGKGAS